MSPRMDRTKLSLKWLEVFQLTAREGSVQRTGQVLGLSNGTVSHHISSLEKAVGTDLFDHRRRPLVLTTAGQILLRRVDESMSALRLGLTEVLSEDLGALLRVLRVSAIEDFDPEVTPRLAQLLLNDLPSSDLSFRSAPSHEILGQLQSDETDIGVASFDEVLAGPLTQRLLLRDPFVIVAPRDCTHTAQDYLADRTDLAFLRYSKRQIIGRRVEAQLRRMRLDITRRMELESTAAALSLVSKGRAWTITTALNCASSQQFLGELRILPMPDGAFARKLSIFGRENLPTGLLDLAETHLRTLIDAHVIRPMIAVEPGLKDQLRLLPSSESEDAE